MTDAQSKVPIGEQIGIVEHWAADRRQLAGEMADAVGYEDARAAWLDQARRLDAAARTLRWVDANAELLRRVVPMLVAFPEAEAIGDAIGVDESHFPAPPWRSGCSARSARDAVVADELALSVSDADMPINDLTGDLEQQCDELAEVLRSAVHALRSYQYGNASPDLAKDVADRADRVLAGIGGATA